MIRRGRYLPSEKCITVRAAFRGKEERAHWNDDPVVFVLSPWRLRSSSVVQQRRYTEDLYRDEQIIQEQRELQRTPVTGGRRVQSLQEPLFDRSDGVN